MTIFEIDREILNCVDETGEVIDFEKLVELNMEREAKCENIACWIIDLNAEAEAIRKQEIILAERRKVTEAKAERLKAYLSGVLGGEKMKTAKVNVGYRKSTVVEIAEDADIPEAFLRYKVEPDKTAIKEALKKGICVDGCSLVEKTSILVK